MCVGGKDDSGKCVVGRGTIAENEHRTVRPVAWLENCTGAESL